MADFRISCNVPSGYNAVLLSEWARITKRPIADLGSRLLEEALNAALRENRIPKFIVEKLNERFEKAQEGKPEPIENIRESEIEGDAYRRVYKRRQEERFNAANKHFEEEAEQMDMAMLKEQCEVLPGI